MIFSFVPGGFFSSFLLHIKASVGSLQLRLCHLNTTLQADEKPHGALSSKC